MTNTNKNKQVKATSQEKAKQAASSSSPSQKPSDYCKKVQDLPPLSPASARQVGNRFLPLATDFPALPYITVANTPFARTQSNTLVAPSQLTPLSSPPNTQPTSSSPKSRKSYYIPKFCHEHIILTQFKDSPDLATMKHFASNLFFQANLQWLAEDASKNQQFYELILVDSQSIELIHIKDKNSSISYSKCYIKKVMRPNDWNTIHKKRSFSIEYSPSGYSYEDYRQAWYRAFLIRPFDHSWFFMFHRESKNDFPIWFYQWWDHYGSQINILPIKAQEGWQTWNTKTPQMEPYIKEVQFHAEFKVPWIWCWSYNITQVLPTPKPMSLVREFRIKWWDAFDTEQCSSKAVQHYLDTGHKLWPKKKNSPNTSTVQPGSSTPPTQTSPSPAAASSPLFNEATYQHFMQFMAFQARQASPTTPVEQPSSSSTRSPSQADAFIDEQDPFDFS